LNLIKNIFRKDKYDFYLCGPMTGYKDLNRPLFNVMAKIIRRMGYTVWNPAEHKMSDKYPVNECIIEDINIIVNKCNGIILLPGWRKSVGGNAEAFIAFLCNKKAVKAVVTFNEKKILLLSVDLSKYKLPYQKI